jgi:hypothetical protein
MKKQNPKVSSDPIVDAIVWVIKLSELVVQLFISIALRKTVDLLRFIDSIVSTEFTSSICHSYGNWFNHRLVCKALDYERNQPTHFKVEVEDTETVNNYLIATIKFEDMTEKNIRMYIPNMLARGISANRKAIQIHKIDDQKVKAIIDIGA